MKTEMSHQTRNRMAKALSRINQGKSTKGLLIIYHGDGQGKSSAAFHLGWRTLCQGSKLGVVQFMGSDQASAEYGLLGMHRQCEFPLLSPQLVHDASAENRQVITSIWNIARSMLQDEGYDMVILDDILTMLQNHLLDMTTILNALRVRFPHQHIVMTGRKAPYELLDIADLAMEMRLLRHPSQSGCPAQAGIEY